jgi:creatinine amidohydrolase
MNLLAEMSWVAVEEYLQRDDRVILPLGATEQHGRHLGLGTDHFEAEAIARGVGEKTIVAVAPTINYGMSHGHFAFAGTMSLRPTTLMAVYEDLLRSLYRHGFRRVLVVNGHGGNEPSLTSTLNLIASDLPDLRVKNFQWWTDAEAYSVVTNALGPQQGSHASAGETAFMLAIHPAGVKMKLLSGKDSPVKSAREFTSMHLFPQKYPDGIMGLNPANATAQLGKALLAKSIEICARELEEWQ